MIPLEELEALHTKLGIDSFYDPRDVLWKNMFDKINALRAAEHAVKDEFFNTIKDAHNHKKLCYYLDTGGHLCRGYIVSCSADHDLHVAGSYGTLWMQDTDHATTKFPSAFDEYGISYSQLMMIEP